MPEVFEGKRRKIDKEPEIIPANEIPYEDLFDEDGDIADDDEVIIGLNGVEDDDDDEAIYGEDDEEDSDVIV